MPNQPVPFPDAVNDVDGRIDHLVVVRESPQHDLVLMEGMIGQTVGHLVDLPGTAEVLAAGIAPVLGEGPFRTFRYRKHRTRAALFEHEGVLYLYSLGSAAKANIDGRENAFVELLCDVIEFYRPRNVHVATFSRLLRSTNFAGRLQHVMRDHVDVLHAGDLALRMRSPEAKIMWAMLALVADMERDLIVQRLFAGTCNAYRTGKWILNDEAVPPGYVLDAQTRRVVIDTAQVEPVRMMLTMMADPSMTSRRVLDEAGRLGLSSAGTRRFHGEDATFADLVRSDSKLASLVDWIDTYETGSVAITLPNPFPGANNIASLDVEGQTDSDPGVVRFTYDWGIPDGGWAPPEVLHSARQRCRGQKDRRTNRGGASHQQRKPFAGWVEWVDDEHTYRLSGTKAHYVLLRQRLDNTETDTDIDTEPVFGVDDQDVCGEGGA